MAIKNKLWYGERVLEKIYHVRSRDEKIDIREVFLTMDSVANQLAKEGLLEFWKLGGMSSVDEHWITTFEPLNITDVTNQPSYLTLPATYISLPNVMGIVNVYFINTSGTKKKYYDPVIIMQYRDVANYRNTLGGDLEGRLGCYPKNGILYFTQSGVAAKYGTCGIQLMIRDSSQIADDGLFPIDPAMEHQFINLCYVDFMERKGKAIDVLKDNNEL